MALCKYCGKHNDITDWPAQFQVFYRPELCFSCYEELPDRADYDRNQEDEEDEQSDELPVPTETSDDEVPNLPEEDDESFNDDEPEHFDEDDEQVE